MRTSMSHGPFDLLALGNDDIALIEVKATNGGRFYPSKSPGTVEAFRELARIASACADNVIPIVAIYFGEIDDFRFFTPLKAAEGPVGPDDADLTLVIRALPPKPSSPPTTYPPRSDEGARASEDGRFPARSSPPPHEMPPSEPTPAMREAADTV